MADEHGRTALAAERARLQAIIDNIPAGVALAEAPTGRIILGNAQIERILGHPLMQSPDVAAYAAWRGFHPDGRSLAAEEYPLARALRGEAVRGLEALYERDDGRRVWVRADAAPIRDDDGAISGAIVLITDIDAERQARDAMVRDRARIALAQKAARLGHFEWTIATNENVWSEELEAIYGLPPGGFDGGYEGWRARVHPDDIERAEADVQRALRDGELVSEWRAVWPDGTVRWLLARGVVMFDALGQPTRMIGVNLDVTETRRAEAALRAAEEARAKTERRLEVALAAARLGSWHLDLQTRELWCSAGCKANFGLPPEAELTYDGWFAAIHPEDRPAVDAAMRAALKERGTYDSEYRVVWPDGTTHWIAAQGKATYDSAGRAVVMDGVTADRTPRKLMEDSLRRQAAALEEADRRKDEFLAMLSHELRNPLAALSSAVEVLALESPEGSRVIAQVQGVLDRQVTQLVRLVDDLLEVSRITRGKIDLRRRPVDLGEVVTAAVETSRPMVEARRHVLDVRVDPGPLMVDGDAARLAQVVTNLLNNAAKYTEVGGRLSLSLERDAGEAVLRVADNGIGIEAEMLSRVFDMFAQADSSLHRAQSGLGIGLTLVRSLVEMHGGAVEVQSAGPGQGSTFVVRLPTLDLVAVPARSTPPRIAPTAAPGRRVLVVDDNVDAAESLGVLLEVRGHVVRLAHDGETALDTARDFRPDVVLLDVGLPRLDGFAVAARLRQDPAMSRTVVVALTGYGSEEDRRRTRAAGFDDHLVKPVAPEMLFAILADNAAGESSSPH